MTEVQSVWNHLDLRSPGLGLRVVETTGGFGYTDKEKETTLLTLNRSC